MTKSKKPEKTDETPESGPPLTALVFEPEPEPDPGPDDDVVDARSLEPAAAAERPRHATMRRRWFDNQPTLVRFISTVLVPVSLHTFVKVGASKMTLHCNGGGCALCLAKHKPTPSFLLALYFIDDAEVAVIDFPRTGGATSLLAQLLPLLKRPNFTELIVEVCKDGKGHSVAVVADVGASTSDEGDYGDDVLRDFVARGGAPPAAIRAVFERWDNQTLLAEVERLPMKIRTYHPGADLSKL